ncbi:hypothetical protein JAAARDRAFT_56105 [Jaapia argillacea MUCL 33604]|uniref:Carboxylic ester hydrolase n=1 Tax=Jaapia argillacea MUCL 33604 TaxID=933084 RepID=A0A067PZ82_9AGAM|nr:hypothetical protein JAAARDRAFT_56105 [Jaapia argillacea MUCL 33604]
MPSKVVRPSVHHKALNTTFDGFEHPISTPEARVHQYRGVKYASVPARFRQSKLQTSYPSHVDCTRYGPICPQVIKRDADAAMFGLTVDDVPSQVFKQNEFECLNLNITCPGDISPESAIPVMLWIHGGGNHGSGSSWVYDGGNLVSKSIMIGKPIILVTFNYRLGIFGFAASTALEEDNRVAGDEGVGNYGLCDQRAALEWVHEFISEFGGDPNNITLFGESTGASDILYHLVSVENEVHPLFHRAIIQSAMIDHVIPDVRTATWHLSKVLSALRIHTVAQLRAVEADKLVSLGYCLRIVDDGIFLRHGWNELLFPQNTHHRTLPYEVNLDILKSHPLHPSEIGHADLRHHFAIRSSSKNRSHSKPRSRSRSRPRHRQPTIQPIIIGDIFSSSHLYSLPASLWTPDGVVRRVRAVCQSLTKASNLLRAYDISPHTEPEDLPERLLDLITDARLAWPTESVAAGIKKERGGRGVYRFIFDQEGPGSGPVELAYLFDNVPLPVAEAPSYPDSFDSSEDEDEDQYMVGDGDGFYDSSWDVTDVDQYSYSRVRDAMQERWIAFAYGEGPWREDSVFVFGPEGETGERSWSIFEGRRRKQTWREALEPLGMQLVQKVGIELSNGPPIGSRVGGKFF